MNSIKSSLMPIVVPVVAIVGGIALWELFAGVLFPSIFIPSFSQSLSRASELVASGDLWLHAWASIRRILLGFIIGSLLGAPIGLLMGSVPFIRMVLNPYVQFLRFIPAIAWLTPAAIWFGIGEFSKVAIIVYTTVFIVVINTAVGVANVPANKVWAAKMLGASKLQTFFLVTTPASMPYSLTGMMLAMTGSFTAVVSAEMVGANEGLGYLIFSSRLWMDTQSIFVAIVLIGFLGLLVDLAFRALIRRFAGQYGVA